MKKKQRTTVVSQKRLAADIYDLQLSAPEIAAEACAGQFVNVYCADRSRLLPRPISLAGIDRENGTIRLVYRVSGAGTEEFSHLRRGDTAAMLGPLGNGFPVEEISKRKVATATDGNTDKMSRQHVLLIGGGIGIPPLWETARELKKSSSSVPKRDVSVTAVLGYRDGCTFLAEEFRDVCDRVWIATEDGSVGTRGTVLDVIREETERSDTGMLPGEKREKAESDTDVLWFACGPASMLRALQSYAAENGIPCWLSLEERMACGVGACLACVCNTVAKDEHSQVKNRRICKDGPVFRAEEVVL